MRAVAAPGRWVWGVSGLVTAAAIAVPGTFLIAAGGGHHGPPPMSAMIRTVTVPQPVTSLNVETYGGQLLVVSRPVSRIQITETIAYVPQEGAPPAVTDSVSDGQLSLGDAACAQSDCNVNYTVAVPPGVTVTAATQGGSISVFGAAGANLDSSGGDVDVTRIDGPLTVTTGGGNLVVTGLTGALRADTAGGSLVAHDVTAATASVTTGGGDAGIAFAAAPDTVTVSTDGGMALLNVPGGPYALTADSDGGTQQVGIATNPAAHVSLTVTTGGGPLQIEP
jgi:hypothetical protein